MKDWHDRLKLHLMVGTSTHIVTSVELSGPTSHDSPFYIPLVDATAKAGFTMREVSADKAYSSVKNLQATEAHGAIAFIPFRSNTVMIVAQMCGRMVHFYSFKCTEFMATGAEQSFWVLYFWLAQPLPFIGSACVASPDKALINTFRANAPFRARPV